MWKLLKPGCFALAAIIGLSTSVFAEPANQQSTIAYRLAKAKTMHFEDQATADKHFQVVQKLGCVVSQDAHGGHIDVRYSCPDWKSLTVESHSLAHQWQEWLKKSGFETLHAEPAGVPHNHAHDHAHDHAAGHEAVSYSLSKWVTQQHQTESAARSSAAVLRGLGCEVKEAPNGAMFEVSFRCPKEMSLQLTSHEVAHGWEAWLKRMGFQVRHEH